MYRSNQRDNPNEIEVFCNAPCTVVESQLHQMIHQSVMKEINELKSTLVVLLLFYIYRQAPLHGEGCLAKWVI